MRLRPALVLLSTLFLTLHSGTGAEQHRATRLGQPATRFAPPLRTPEDLRARFRDAQLRPDIASILRQWGWAGNLDDLHTAAVSVEIEDITIPIGTVMPFMSSRENGRPICLRNVTWAGDAPAPAYAFNFTSRGRRYRCITPKACSNFFVMDLGEELKSLLGLDCEAPTEVLAGHPVQVCLNLRNTGNGPEARTAITLSVPDGASVARTTENGVFSDGVVRWEVANLGPGLTNRLCVFLAARQPAQLAFRSRAEAPGKPALEAACATEVLGVPAILLELVDVEDPVEVGKEVTYEVRVTNQGSATGTNIRINCHLPPSEEFVSGSGVTPVKADASLITTEALPELAPKAQATWRVVVKAREPADARFKLELTSDQFQRPIEEEESTQLY